MSIRHWISVLWPAFILACLMELLVFALVDPHDLRWAQQGEHTSRQAIYTLSFLVFWLVGAVSAALTLAIATRPPIEQPDKGPFKLQAD
jgi:hypothetical protein